MELDLESGWRSIQLTYFHTGHDPKFSFEMEGPGFPRSPLPESILSVSREPIAALEPLSVDPARGPRSAGVRHARVRPVSR